MTPELEKLVSLIDARRDRLVDDFNKLIMTATDTELAWAKQIAAADAYDDVMYLIQTQTSETDLPTGRTAMVDGIGRILAIYDDRGVFSYGGEQCVINSYGTMELTPDLELLIQRVGVRGFNRDAEANCAA